MKLCVFVLWMAGMAVASAGEVLPVPAATPLTIGETLSFKSAVLNETRQLNVYLPDSYAQQPEKRYPVVYLLDGSRDEDLLHIAGLTQFASFSWIGMMPEAIVVGIGNVDRKRDFTHPSEDERDRSEFPTAGHSAAFIEFLKTELKPMVHQRYRTASEDVIIGQSLGGLLLSELLHSQPQLFTHHIVVSPSLWWANETLLKRTLESLPVQGRVFIGVGAEGEVMERLARDLHSKLKPLMAQPGHLMFKHYPQLNHGDTLHLAAYDALDFVFQISTEQ